MVEEQEITIQEERQQAHADFAAGYNKARGIESPTKAEATTGGDESTDGTTVGDDNTAQAENLVADKVADAVEEVAIFAGLTEAQVKAKFDRLETLEGTSQKLAGQVGAMKDMIHQLKNAQKQQPQAIAKLERLSAAYPELAEILHEDLKGFVPQFDPDADRIDPEKLVEERVSKAVSDFGMSYFESQHPDWKERVASEDYDAWRATLSPEEFQKTQTSNDLFYASKKMSEFKSWCEDYRKQQEKQQGEAQAAERLKQEQKRRLAAAAQPSGLAPVTQSALSEEEAFMQARRSKPSLRSAN